MVSVLAGGGGKCLCRKCGNPFVSKKVGQRFCTDRCRINHNSGLLRKKAIPVRTVKCPVCKDPILVRTKSEVPRQRFCSHLCAATHHMLLSRHRKYLVEVGYDEVNGVWYKPDGTATTFDAARKSVGLTKRPKKHQITSDGRTVWVNGVMGLLARFGVNGIDIHRALSDQSLKGECLFCTHAPTTREDWRTFVIKVREYFGIYVRGSYMPTRFRKSRKNNDREGSTAPVVKHQQPAGTCL